MRERESSLITTATYNNRLERALHFTPLLIIHTFSFQSVDLPLSKVVRVNPIICEHIITGGTFYLPVPVVQSTEKMIYIVLGNYVTELWEPRQFDSMRFSL